MTLFRTLVIVEILSDEEVPEDFSLEDIHNKCIWDWSDKIHIGSSTPVDGPTMAALLVAQGSEPGFFNLDDDGIQAS
jgi:hypothetical protein